MTLFWSAFGVTFVEEASKLDFKSVNRVSKGDANKSD